MQSIDEAEAELESMRSQYADMQLTVQPLVFSLPCSTVVAHNKTRLLAESLIKGVDLCLKLIIVIDFLYFFSATLKVFHIFG